MNLLTTINKYDQKDKKYCFNYEEYYNAFKEIYPTKGYAFNLKINYENFTKENLDKLFNILTNILNNPLIKEKENYEIIEEEITCLPNQTIEVFNKLFDNKALAIFGHGGAGKKIIESEGMYCRYPNLGSHFLQLSKTNESLSQLNDWPHLGSKQILIMALNNEELNPIYIKKSKKNSLNEEYLIPNEYFVGYYDTDSKLFYLNPNFKIEHKYDELATGYVFDEEFFPLEINLDDVNIINLYRNLEKIFNVLYMASIKVNLSRRGYIEVTKQILKYMNDSYKIQDTLTPEYIENLKQNEQKKIELENNNNDIENNFDESLWNFDDWNLDDKSNTK